MTELQDRTGVEAVCDPHTVDGQSDRRQHHSHEQPLGPWRHWLGRLTRPGDLVADPYCGGGTVPVALRQIGGRKCVATEIALANVRVARAVSPGQLRGRRLVRAWLEACRPPPPHHASAAQRPGPHLIQQGPVHRQRADATLSQGGRTNG